METVPRLLPLVQERFIPGRDDMLFPYSIHCGYIPSYAPIILYLAVLISPMSLS